MKKALTYLSLAACSAFTSCKEDEAQNIPELPFVDSGTIEFVEGPAVDTLNLRFQFSDGDFDLGLDYNELAPPYHFYDFFLLQNGNLIRIESKEVNDQVTGGWHTVLVPNNNAGKLVSYRKLVSHNSQQTFQCYEYFPAYHPVLIEEVNSALIDNTYHITDTLTIDAKEYIEISDSVKFEYNHNAFNIHVDYMVEQPDGSYELFDWQKNFCTMNFHARFPMLDGMVPSQPIASGPFTIVPSGPNRGAIKYSMVSLGFRYVMGGKKIKIRFSIKDRSLNTSNTLETQPITIPNP